ncbi:MAG: hypothetical protein ACLGP3_00725 [Acidobacteriota bacterium]
MCPGKLQPWTRREFLRSAAGLGALTAAAPAWSRTAQGASDPIALPPITETRLDLNGIKKWDNSNGDTWDPFWADDDALYSFNCDGRGFGAARQNLAFNGFSGDALSELTGRSIQPMEEYGKAGLRGPDHATWKACGQECIDGVFYAFVARNVYGSESHDPLMRQTALNASLIKSHDRGRTWTRSAAENYARPMWPGAGFGAPFFVHYGQNGGKDGVDGSDAYVYAAATNGFWNDGDFLTLGRVRRDRLARLDPADWQYYRGGSGMAAASWTANVYEGAPILARPARCGQTPITWAPALRRYLLISWYNPQTLTQWFKPSGMRYDFYQAEHPWGPWAPLASFTDRFLAPGSTMYGPSLCAKYQQSGSEEVVVPMFTAGCPFEDQPSGIYKCWMIPLRLRTAPLPAHTTILWSDSAMHRQGNWRQLAASPGRDNAALESVSAGSALRFSFEGTGVEILARKASGYGNVQLSLDAEPAATAALGTINFPEISGVSVFRRLNLSPGRHSLRFSHAGGGAVNLQAVNVYL